MSEELSRATLVVCGSQLGGVWQEQLFQVGSKDKIPLDTRAKLALVYGLLFSWSMSSSAMPFSAKGNTGRMLTLELPGSKN